MIEKFLELRDINSYKISFSLSNYVWQLIVKWDWFEKTTVGSQFVRSVDSVSANIAEGFGRCGKKDKVKFYRYAFGSVKESLDWNQKCKARNLISKVQYQFIFDRLISLPKEINSLIYFINSRLKE